VAGVKKLAKQGYFDSPSVVVATLTGHGLKDPDRVIKTVELPQTAPASLEAILKIIDF
jgi:threonine synthase